MYKLYEFVLYNLYNKCMNYMNLELLTTVIPVIFSVSVFPGIRYSRYRYFSVSIVVLYTLAGTHF